jgi:hypothetical protein
MRAPIFYGCVEGGRIVLDNKGRFTPYLQTFEGQRIELVLREKRTTRSDRQNSYYHAIVVQMISEKTGHSHDETHEILKKQFNIESTAKLKTSEFEDYLSVIKVWAAEFLDLPIPDPGTVDY